MSYTKKELVKELSNTIVNKGTIVCSTVITDYSKPNITMMVKALSKDEINKLHSIYGKDVAFKGKLISSNKSLDNTDDLFLWDKEGKCLKIPKIDSLYSATSYDLYYYHYNIQENKMEKLFNKIKSLFTKSKKEENLSIEEIIKKHVYEDNDGVKEYRTIEGPVIFPEYSNTRIPGYIVELSPMDTLVPDYDNTPILIGRLKSPSSIRPEIGELIYNRKGECINNWLNDEWRKRLSLKGLNK